MTRQWAEKADANQQEIINLVLRQGGKAWFIRWPLDLLVVYHGKIAIWEVKSEKGKFTDNQKIILAEMLHRGYEVPIIRSVEDAQRALEAMQ